MQRALLATLVLVVLVPSAAAAAEVKTMGGFFDPASLEIVVGEEVIWTNEDSMPHSVTSNWDGGESFDAVLRGGESFSWTFSDPGDFIVHCRPHAYPNESGGMDGMAMTIAVGPLESVGNIGGPVNQTPLPAVAVVIVAMIVGTMLLRRRS